METKRLLKGLAQGHYDAQAAFCKEYGGRLNYFVRGFLPTCRADASPTVVSSSVMRRVLNGLQANASGHNWSVKSKKELDALVFAIAKRRALNEIAFLMAQRRHPTRVVSDQELIGSRFFVESFSREAQLLAQAVILVDRTIQQASAELGIAESDADHIVAEIRKWMERARLEPARVMGESDMAQDGAVLDQVIATDQTQRFTTLVEDLLKSLDEISRKIVVMRIQEARQWSEVAEEVGLTAPACRRRLNAALEVLRKELLDGDV